MCDHYHPLSTDTPESVPGAYTRRRFLGGSLALLSTAATAPAFLGRTGSALADTTMRLSSTPGGVDHRVLVVIQLSGGNDGLNTVVPFGDDNYHRARPHLNVTEGEAIKLVGVDGIGLHPTLSPIGELIDTGQAAILQGVGYPNPNRSHFKSMDIWQQGTIDPAGADRGKGWIGKAMDGAIKPTDPDAGVAVVALAGQSQLATVGRSIQPVSFDTPRTFRWAGHDLDDSVSAAYGELSDAPQSLRRLDDPASFVRRTAMDAQAASSRLRKASEAKTNTRFPATGLGRQLRSVAGMIKSELPTRVYYVGMGGFDTHAGQGNRHTNLLREFAQAVKAFQTEMTNTGHADRVVTVAFSEFGRRLRENASAGTDHGAAGPVFVFGNAVKPGLHGAHPSLTKLDQGDLIHHTDFRGVYTDLLENWMRMDASAAVAGRFKTPGVIRRGV
ncbi:MAG: DUF1501 domain-containing protein [Planctomycetota bacterium]